MSRLKFKDQWFSFLKRFSLQSRILILMLSLLLLTVSAVAFISYNKSKENAIQFMEQRMTQEVRTIYDLAQNLMLIYVGDQEKFNAKMEQVIKRQDAELAKDGLQGNFFLISEKEAVPFKISKNSSIKLPKPIQEEIRKKQDGLLHKEINGEQFTISFQSIQEFKGIYAIAIPQKLYLMEINDMAKYITIVALLSLTITSVIIILLVRNLTKPLSKLREVMKEARNGKLDVEINAKTSTPEIISLIKSFEAMIEQISSLLNKISSTTKDLSKTGTELKRFSGEVLEENDHLMEAIEVVKLGAGQTAASSDNSIKMFQNMKQSISAINEHMQKAMNKTHSMNTSASTGEKNLKELMLALDQFGLEVKSVSSTVNEVKQHSESIATIINLIQQMASQTKLLSLNAAIEAARAGEAGSGFAVVANEVRKLAEQSEAATGNIKQTIEKMESISVKASDEYTAMFNKFKAHLQIASESRQSFDLLMTEIDAVSEMIGLSQAELKKFNKNLPAIESSAEEFVSISQQTAASAEQMQIASQKQAQKMMKHNEIGNRLTHLSESLAKLNY